MTISHIPKVEKKLKKEREEAKRRILEDPDISKDALEFMLSLPVERKIPSHGT
jgi:hypothetical protein